MVKKVMKKADGGMASKKSGSHIGSQMDSGKKFDPKTISKDYQRPMPSRPGITRPGMPHIDKRPGEMTGGGSSPTRPGMPKREEPMKMGRGFPGGPPLLKKGGKIKGKKK